MKNCFRLIIQLLALLCCAANAVAQQRDGRGGVELGLELTSELQATHRGDFNNANLLRLRVSLPVSRSVTIDVASLSTLMTAEESIGGDLQTFSNIDAINIPFALSVCGIGLQIGKRNSLFMGIRNMNEDYFCSDVTSLFTNSSCGIYPTISANCAIANYPMASVGMHYCYDADRIKVQASVYNGAGYHHISGREKVFRFSPKDDGIFGVAEVAYRNAGSFYSLGTALHTDDDTKTMPWIYFEQYLCRNLTLIAGYSHAFAEDAECSDFAGLGFRYQAKRCELGMFTDIACFDGGNEYATELTCKIPLSSIIYIQPTVHFIATPSADGRSTFCSAALLRLGIAL